MDAQVTKTTSTSKSSVPWKAAVFVCLVPLSVYCLYLMNTSMFVMLGPELNMAGTQYNNNTRVPPPHILTGTLGTGRTTDSDEHTDLTPIPEAAQRLTRVSTVCKKAGNAPKSLTPGHFRHFLVNERYKVLYCYVPKVACTSWKYIMAVASGKMSRAQLDRDRKIVHFKEKQTGITRLSSYKMPEITEKLATYTKFLIARNPLSRVYSAYKNKFLRDYRIYGKKHYKKWLNGLINPKLQRVKGELFLPFSRFVKEIVAAKMSHKQIGRDEHWNQISNLCHPCSVDFDIIAKLETMEEDKETLLKLFNESSLPKENQNMDQSNPFGFVPPPIEKAYGELKEQTLGDFFKVYNLDFELFGYFKSILTLQANNTIGQT